MLSNSPNEIANATKGLDGAVNDLRGFLAENREGLGTTVDQLNAITTALNDSRGDVKQVLHITPTVFQNFMNIYQPAQSAVTGILAPVNFANTVQFICSAIQAASRRGFEQSAKLCVQYLAPIIKNRQYNFPPFGVNPFVGASARPNEITYSEDRLNPHLPPAGARGAAERRGGTAARRSAAVGRPTARGDSHRCQPGAGRPDGPPQPAAYAVRRDAPDRGARRRVPVGGARVRLAGPQFADVCRAPKAAATGLTSSRRSCPMW